MSINTVTRVFRSKMTLTQHLASRPCKHIKNMALAAKPRTRSEIAFFLATSPLPRLSNWVARVNDPLTQAELSAVRRCEQRGRPLGDDDLG